MGQVRPRLVAAAALVAAGAAALVAGSADAQVVGSIIVTPTQTDPGASVTVANGASSPCTPPLGATSASVSVDLYAVGSATPANRVPYLGAVTLAGGWSVEVRLAPDLPPGSYRVQAACFTDSGLNAGFGPAYEPGRLELRQKALGAPRPGITLGRPGDTFQVTSAEVPCVPPVGAAGPRVRVSLLDAGTATRAEAEGSVDPATGRWSVSLTVPSVDAQAAQISAVCLARVGASVPYARYAAAPFNILATPSTVPTTLAEVPTPTAPVPSSGGSTTTASTAPPVAMLPTTPLAQAIVVEPTYTG